MNIDFHAHTELDSQTWQTLVEAGLGRALERYGIYALAENGATIIHIDHTSFDEKAIQLSQQNRFTVRHKALRYYLELEPKKNAGDAP